MCFSHKHRISCFCCSYSCNRKVHMKLTLNYFIIMRPKAWIAVLYGLLFNHWAVNLSRSEKHPFEQLMRFLHGAAGSDCGMFILWLQTVHSLHVLRVFVHSFILLWQNALRCLQTALITYRSFDVCSHFDFSLMQMLIWVDTWLRSTSERNAEFFIAGRCCAEYTAHSSELSSVLRSVGLHHERKLKHVTLWNQDSCMSFDLRDFSVSSSFFWSSRVTVLVKIWARSPSVQVVTCRGFKIRIL